MYRLHSRSCGHYSTADSLCKRNKKVCQYCLAGYMEGVVCLADCSRHGDLLIL